MEAIDKIINYTLELGINTDNLKNDFESRFKIQKIAFLMEDFIKDKDYRFSLYIRGPYSPALTDEYFNDSNLEKFHKKQKTGTITASETEALEKLKKILANGSNDRLEAMATANYLLKKGAANWLNLEEKVTQVKPAIRKDDIVLGINDLKIFLTTEKDWEEFDRELKEETEFWDRLSDEMWSKIEA